MAALCATTMATAAARAGFLADREALGDHLPGRTAQRGPDALEETLALLRRRVVEDGGAERVDEHLAAALERMAQLVGAQPPSGDGLRELAQGEVLHERDRLEVMGPAAHRTPLYRAPGSAATLITCARWTADRRSSWRRWRSWQCSWPPRPFATGHRGLGPATRRPGSSPPSAPARSSARATTERGSRPRWRSRAP